jgi:serine/threonine-protein kinase
MGQDVDGRVDQYALAATAYHLLTAATPFPDSTPATAISGHLNAPPPSLAVVRPELAALDPVLAAGMAKDPNARFVTCTDFARALADPSLADATMRATSAPTTAAPIVAVPPWAAAGAHPIGLENSQRNADYRRTLPVIGVAAVVVLIAAVIAFIVARMSTPDSSAPVALPPSSAGAPNLSTVTVVAPPSVPETVTITAGPSTRAPRQETPSGDLGLSVPMTRPACDGMGIVVLGSVTTPGQYAAGVQRYLNAYPGASYLRTDMACPSLRQTSDRGTPIYAVFYPAGYTESELCTAVRRVGGNAYGRWLDKTTSPDEQLTC